MSAGHKPATPITDDMREKYSEGAHDGIGEFIADIFASHESLERDRARLVAALKVKRGLLQRVFDEAQVTERRTLSALVMGIEAADTLLSELGES